MYIELIMQASTQCNYNAIKYTMQLGDNKSIILVQAIYTFKLNHAESLTTVFFPKN